VEDPRRDVEAAQRPRAEAEPDERAAERPADGRPWRPPRLDDRQPARLHHEPGHVDDEEQGERPREARRGFEAGGPTDEAPPYRHAQADHEEEAEEIEHRLVEEVEVPLQELVAEERQRDVPVDRGEDRAHEQGEEAPEHDRVHDARIGLRQRSHLPERVGGDEPDALGDPVEPVLRQALPPERHSLPEAVDEKRDRDRAADVQRDLSPARDVPERIAEWNGRGHGRNLSTGRTRLAEGAKSAPYATSRGDGDVGMDGADGAESGPDGGAGGARP